MTVATIPHLSDVATFARLQLESQDMDPAYPILRARIASLPNDEERHRYVFLYLAYYSLASAEIAYNDPNALKLPTGFERRGLRAEGDILKHRQSLSNLTWLSGYRRWLEGGLTGDREADYLWIRDVTLREPWGNGRWAAYKAQPESEPVLTPSGWRPIGELAVGDSVIGADGRATRVVGVYPQGERDVYRVEFTDRSWVRCDAEHLWQVRHIAHGSVRVLTTAEIGAGRRQRSGNTWWAVPLVANAVDYEPRDLPLDPYVLGVLLGDGNLGPHGSVRFTSADAEVAAEVERRLPAGCVVKSGALYNHAIVYENGRRYSRSRPNAVRNAIAELGLRGARAWEKFVPDSYMFATPDERLLLLQGLLDTDGYALTSGAGLSVTSEPLAQAAVDIVRSLGGLARLTSYEGTNRRVYRAVLHLPPGVPAFRLSRKAARSGQRKRNGFNRTIARIEPSGREDAVCIRVAAPDQLYVTRGYVVTHNTAEVLEKVLGYPITATDMGNDGSSGPMQGLETLFGARPAGREEAVQWADDLGLALQSSLRRYGVDLAIDELETVLCNWHSMAKGNYYSGSDIDGIQEQLLHAEAAGADVAPLWQARRAALPEWTLGEVNGWVGEDKDRKRAYQRTGAVLRRTDPWPVSTT